MKKRILCLLACIMMAITTIPATAFASNTADYTEITAEKLTYEVNTDGTAIITACDKSVSGNLIVPDSIGGHVVSAIGKQAFAGDFDICKLQLPDTIKTIGYEAFGNCQLLETMNMPAELETVEAFAFCYTGLDEVIFPDTLKNLGEGAFMGSEVKNVEFKGNGINFSSRIFEVCFNLTSVNLPEDMTEIPDYMFSWCYNLESVDIPDTISAIGKSAFCKCQSLKSLDIPESVVSFGREAFYECYHLKEIKIPDTAESLGAYVFSDCNSLQSVEIPESVKFIDLNTFNNTDGSRIATTIYCYKGSGVNEFLKGTLYNFKVIGCEHEFEEICVTKEPTCGEKGEKLYSCINCGENQRRDIECLPHTELIIPGSAPDCIATGGTERIVCAVCNAVIKELEIIPATGIHKYDSQFSVPLRATFGKKGTRSYECVNCHKAKRTEIIPAVAAPKLSQKTYVFDNTAKTPKVTIKGLKSSQYTVKYPNSRKGVGRYEVTVTLKDRQYKGSKKLYFTINPKGLNISKLTKGKKQITVKWVKQAKIHLNQIDGYQIRYSTNANMNNSKSVKVGKVATKKIIKNLKAKKKYYVQIRAYEESGLNTYYSTWSKAKAIKTN